MRRLLELIFTALLILFASTTPVGAIEYGGIGGIPAHPDKSNPRTKSIFVYTIAANAQKLDGVRVTNNSNKVKTIEIYATDSEVSSGGSFACKQKVDPKNEIGSWVHFSKNSVQLAPATNEVVPFTITVPKHVDVGEHDGCIVIQERTTQPKATGNGVQLSVRSALRLVVTVPGDINKDLQITGVSIKPARDKHTITVALKNNGNVSLDTNVQVVVKNLLGKIAYRNGGVYPVLAQKQQMELNFEMNHSFWGGLYRVITTAEYDSDPKATLGEKSNQQTKRTAPTKLIFVAPKAGATLVYVAALLLIVFGVWKAKQIRKNKRHIGETWTPYTIKKSDTLHSLAESHHVSWKTIAQVNRLKPPYVLEPKTEISLPPKPKKTKLSRAKKSKVTKDDSAET